MKAFTTKTFVRKGFPGHDAGEAHEESFNDFDRAADHAEEECLWESTDRVEVIKNATGGWDEIESITIFPGSFS